MSSNISYKELEIHHPGYYIKDLIVSLGQSEEEFALSIGTSFRRLDLLLSGQYPLSSVVAQKIEKITGVSADLLLNIQNEYDNKMKEMSEDSYNEVVY